MPRTAQTSRVNSMSPQAQPVTKRDKRRNNMADRLADMINGFSRDQSSHYRAQLQAIQVDMTLILRADPYDIGPRDDSPDTLDQLIDTVTAGTAPIAPEARDGYLAMAGKQYHQYCLQINSAQEQRDADLTALKNRYDSASAHLLRDTEYKTVLANAEYKALAATVQRRLINTVTRKRDRLLKEKEQLNIVDTNPLTFNPNHFTANLPASPNPHLAQRKMRHTRQRPLDDGDASATDRGRKRKANDDDPADSQAYMPPRPSTALSDMPSEKSVVARTNAQYEAPVYSIEQLFTEKELALASSIGQIAARDVLYRQQQQQQPNTDVPVAVPLVAAPTVTDAETQPKPAEATQPNPEGSPPQMNADPSSTMDMERTQSYHATRGATKANPLSFTTDAAAAFSSDNIKLLNPFIPNMIPITKTERGAPTPPSLTGADAEGDLALMLPSVDTNGSSASSEKDVSLQALRNKYLEQACSEPSSTQPFRLPITDIGPAAIRGGVNRPAHLGFADAASLPNGLRNGSSTLVSASQGASSQGLSSGNVLGVNGSAVASGVAAASAYLGLGVDFAPGMSRATSAAGSEMGLPAASGESSANNQGGAAMRRTRTRLI